ncbi:hypothetical protein [Acidithiobacillus ferrianus]|uniref:hypothetical protein n=1 Tax=Acidithiobacillus ferrianus TaxID=2678518 RepID=UPI0034E5563B
MSTTFHTYVKKYQAVRPERLYGDFRKYTETAFTTDDASIYFIVKCMAAEWLPDTFVVGGNYNLLGRLRVDGKEHDVPLDMGAFWFAMPQIQQHFPAKDQMSEYFMARSKAATGLSVPNAVKYQRGTSI